MKLKNFRKSRKIFLPESPCLSLLPEHRQAEHLICPQILTESRKILSQPPALISTRHQCGSQTLSLEKTAMARSSTPMTSWLLSILKVTRFKLAQVSNLISVTCTTTPSCANQALKSSKRRNLKSVKLKRTQR